METDIGESTDVAAAHLGEVERLRGLAKQMKDDLGSGRPPAAGTWTR